MQNNEEQSNELVINEETTNGEIINEETINEELNDKLREDAVFDGCDFLMELISTYGNYLIEKKDIKELSKMVVHFGTYFESVPENIKTDYEAYMVRMNELEDEAVRETNEMLQRMEEKHERYLKKCDEDIKMIGRPKSILKPL